MAPVDAALAAGWGLFWIYWLVSAFGAKPSARGQDRWLWAARAAVWIAAIVLFRVHLLGTRVDLLGSSANGYAVGAGLTLFVLGLGTAVWARVHMGENWGMPTTLKQEPTLVTSGPYRLVRHPIYSGILLALLGTAIAASLEWLLVLGLAGAYFVYSAFIEERNLSGLFPEGYPAYRQRTKMLVPFIF